MLELITEDPVKKITGIKMSIIEIKILLYFYLIHWKYSFFRNSYHKNNIIKPRLILFTFE